MAKRIRNPAHMHRLHIALSVATSVILKLFGSLLYVVTLIVDYPDIRKGYQVRERMGAAMLV